jgi:type VI secretion system protein ImpJ
MTKNKNPIMWFHGMSLGPEVYQQNFIYQEEVRKQLFQSINPFGWGIIELEWDESNFSQGILKVKKLKCILPDLTFLNITEENNLIINFENKKEELKKELFLNLSLPNNYYTKQPNVSNPRYSPINQEVQDLNDENNKTTLSFLKPEFFLSLDETFSAHVSLPLGKLIFNGMTFSFTKYLPPSLNIKTYASLISKMEQILGISKNKLRYLVSKQDFKGKKSLIYNISNICNHLEAAISSKYHPFELYKTLVDLFANAFVLSDNQKIPHIPAYEHTNCETSIYEMLNFISENIEKVDQQYSYHKFSQNNNLFAIFPKFIDNKIIIGIEKNTASSSSEIMEWIGNAIIASEDKITNLQDQRAKGANRALVENHANMSLQPTQGLILIEIERNPVFIDESKALCIAGIDNKATNTPSSIYIFEKE